MQSRRKKLCANSVYSRVEYRFTFSLNLCDAPLHTEGRPGGVGVYSAWRIIVAATGSISCSQSCHPVPLSVSLSLAVCFFISFLVYSLCLLAFPSCIYVCIPFQSPCFSLFYLNSARACQDRAFRLTRVGEFASAHMSQKYRAASHSEGAGFDSQNMLLPFPFLSHYQFIVRNHTWGVSPSETRFLRLEEISWARIRKYEM